MGRRGQISTVSGDARPNALPKGIQNGLVIGRKVSFTEGGERGALRNNHMPRKIDWILIGLYLINRLKSENLNKGRSFENGLILFLLL